MERIKEENSFLMFPEFFRDFVRTNDFILLLEAIYVYCYVILLSDYRRKTFFLGNPQTRKEKKSFGKGSSNYKVFIFIAIYIKYSYFCSKVFPISQIILPFEMKRIQEKGRKIVKFSFVLILNSFIIVGFYLCKNFNEI